MPDADPISPISTDHPFTDRPSFCSLSRQFTFSVGTGSLSTTKPFITVCSNHVRSPRSYTRVIPPSRTAIQSIASRSLSAQLLSRDQLAFGPHSTAKQRIGFRPVLIIGLPQPTWKEQTSIPYLLLKGSKSTPTTTTNSPTRTVPSQYHVSQGTLEMTFRLRTWSSIAIFLLALLPFDHNAFVKGDASFIDVRTNLARDRSGRKGDPIGKYFRRFFVSRH